MVHREAFLTRIPRNSRALFVLPLSILRQGAVQGANIRVRVHRVRCRHALLSRLQVHTPLTIDADRGRRTVERGSEGTGDSETFIREGISKHDYVP